MLNVITLSVVQLSAVYAKLLGANSKHNIYVVATNMGNIIAICDLRFVILLRLLRHIIGLRLLFIDNINLIGP